MSEVKVNKISPRTNCGTVQLGDSGDTITIPAGATITNNGTQTGFGRTGTVDWQTSIKTTSFTAVSGEGYFVNTTSGAITVTLPASPSAGDIVSVKDYAQTFDTNACTIARNGQPIEGQTFDKVLNTEGVAVTAVYGDATKGWQFVNSNEVVNIPLFVAATGGTVTTCGDFRIHTYTGPGTFCVSCKGNPAGSTTVDYLVIAGGASGGTRYSGGGGAGGYRFSDGTASGCYSAGPAPLGASALPVSVQSYPITVGGGGAGVSESPAPTCKVGNRGANSVFSTITSAGGGAGIRQNQIGPGEPTSPGGSGGGGSYICGPTKAGGSGNTPPTDPPQGNDGADGGLGNPYYTSGGGGGAGGVGGCGNSTRGGIGGAGLASSITGSAVTRGGGGGGSGSTNNSTSGGPAHPGGGGGTAGGGSPGTTTGNGTDNTGGGSGGGYGYPGNSGNGGSGIVVIRYKFQ